MTVKLLTEQYMEYLSLQGGCTGSSESTLIKNENVTLLEITCHSSLMIKSFVFIKMNKILLQIQGLKLDKISLHLNPSYS